MLHMTGYRASINNGQNKEMTKKHGWVGQYNKHFKREHYIPAFLGIAQGIPIGTTTSAISNSPSAASN